VSACRRQILLANLEPVWAEGVMRDRGGSLSPESVRALTLLITDDPLAADTAFSERWLELEKERNERANG
jgi:hypothetical protein